MAATNETVNVASGALDVVMDPTRWVGAVQGVLAEYGMKVVGAILILMIGMWVAKLLKKGISKGMEKGKVDQTLIAFCSSMAHVTMQVFVIIAALGALNIPVASFVAVLGAAGLAVGLALQGSLANFAAGVLLIIFKPFKVGDFVEAGGVAGVVVEIGIFTTILKTPDNKKMIVPNAKLSGDNITNFTAHDTRRVDLVVGISYSDDIDKARNSIQAVLSETEGVLTDPAPQVAVKEMADSSVNFVVRPWAKTSDYWDVYFALNEGIKKRFDADDITIPFPQRDVHLYEHKAD